MKIIYHLALPAGIAGICYYQGTSPLALVDWVPALAIALTCIAAALVAEKPHVVLKALVFLIFDRAPGGKKVANLLLFSGRIALCAAALILLLCGIAYFAHPGLNPVALGKTIGYAMLSPLYGLYLYSFVFYPFSARARASF